MEEERHELNEEDNEWTLCSAHDAYAYVIVPNVKPHQTVAKLIHEMFERIRRQLGTPRELKGRSCSDIRLSKTANSTTFFKIDQRLEEVCNKNSRILYYHIVRSPFVADYVIIKEESLPIDNQDPESMITSSEGNGNNCEQTIVNSAMNECEDVSIDLNALPEDYDDDRSYYQLHPTPKKINKRGLQSIQKNLLESRSNVGLAAQYFLKVEGFSRRLTDKEIRDQLNDIIANIKETKGVKPYFSLDRNKKQDLLLMGISSSRKKTENVYNALADKYIENVPGIGKVSFRSVALTQMPKLPRRRKEKKIGIESK